METRPKRSRVKPNGGTIAPKEARAARPEPGQAAERGSQAAAGTRRPNDTEVGWFLRQIRHGSNPLEHGGPLPSAPTVLSIGDLTGSSFLALDRARLGEISVYDRPCKCGWWWCGKLNENIAHGLNGALEFLADHGIDPWSPGVIDVASWYQKIESAAKGHGGIKRLWNAIARLKVEGTAAGYQRKFLDELTHTWRTGSGATWRGTNEGKRGGNHEKRWNTAALNRARELGWKTNTPGVVAAILLLTGLVVEDFSVLEKRLGRADDLRKKALRGKPR